MTSKEFCDRFWHAVSAEARTALVEGLFKAGAEVQREADARHVFDHWVTSDAVFTPIPDSIRSDRENPLMEMPK
jgi:hypothetical protein